MTRGDQVAKGYKKRLLVGRGLVLNETVVVPDARVSLGGSARHTYFSIAYDASAGDVVVRGVLQLGRDAGDGGGGDDATPPFRYTSVTAYDWDSLPLPQYLADESLKPDAGDELSAAERVALAAGARPARTRRFTVYLTRAPTHRADRNELNVAAAPCGLCVVRIVYPASDAVVAACKPSVRAVPFGARA